MDLEYYREGLEQTVSFGERCCKMIVRQLAQIFLKLFFLFPIKNNRIVFASFSGAGYFCNPKYLSEYLVEKYGDRLEIIWAFRKPEKYCGLHGVKITKYYSFQWLFYVLTSRVLISNVGQCTFLPKRKEQLWIDVWHGGGAYKKVVFSTGFVKDFIDNWYAAKGVGRFDLVLSCGRKFTETNLIKGFHHKGEILKCGMPRNDVLFNEGWRRNASLKVRQKLHISGFTVLYAPTFRGYRAEGYRTDLHFPYDEFIKTLEETEGKTVTVLKRAHLFATMADASPGGKIIDVTRYPDMQELLCAADMLITDYSSCIWDYALLGRPCLLYVPDLEEYIKERGFYTPIGDWPGIVCRNKKELLEAVISLNKDDCRERAKEHLRRFGSYETGTACRQVSEKIMQYITGPGVIA